MFAGAGALPRLTPRSITSRAALLAELRQVMTEAATQRIKQELQAQAAWLAAQLPGAT